VFSQEDSAAHIPPARRGVLGRLTPDLIAKTREAIRKFL
jgi:hypothetical protein